MIRKCRWMITALFVVSVLTALIVNLRLPKIYESTATVLPADGVQGWWRFGALLAAGKAADLGMSLPGMPALESSITRHSSGLMSGTTAGSAPFTRFRATR